MFDQPIRHAGFFLLLLLSLLELKEAIWFDSTIDCWKLYWAMKSYAISSQHKYLTLTNDTLKPELKQIAVGRVLFSAKLWSEIRKKERKQKQITRFLTSFISETSLIRNKIFSRDWYRPQFSKLCTQNRRPLHNYGELVVTCQHETQQMLQIYSLF